jgi:6-phosphogluconolactonase (cycloisomerase 2 family)
MRIAMRAFAGLGLLVVLTLAGCGGGNSSFGGTPPPPPPAPAEILYATSYEGILKFSVDSSTGALGSQSLSNFFAGTYGIAATPSASFLYASNADLGTITGFSISKSGDLSEVSGSPFLFTTNSSFGVYPPVDNLAMHPSGKFLYAPNVSENTVEGFAIDGATGNLTALPRSPFPAGSLPLQVAIVPSGAFLYTSNYGDNTISGFTIDSSSGSLTQIGGSPFPVPGEFPDGLIVHPSGKFLYAVVPLVGGVGMGENGVASFTIDQTSGALKPVQGSPVTFGTEFPGPFSIAEDPSGKCLYVLGSSDGKIYEFSIDATTGGLTPLAGSPYNQELILYASDLTVDPSGKFLYYSSESVADLDILQIDGTTGALSPATPSYVPAGLPLGLTVVSVPQQ